MSAPVTVTGGAGSVRVRLGELTALSGVFADVSVALDGNRGELRAAGWMTTPFSAPPADAAGRARLEYLVLQAMDRLDHVIDQTDGIRRHLLHAATDYVEVDRLVGGPNPVLSAGRFTLGLARVVDGLRTGDPFTPLQQEITGRPGAVDTVIHASGLMADAREVAALPEGGIGLAIAGVVTAGRPPRTLADLMRDLGGRNNAPARGAPVDVRVMTAANGSRTVVVNITGTRSWSYGGEDPADLLTNAKAVTGRPTAYEHGVFDAMRRAGVRPDDRVMLVGHSQGGMIAVNAARDARRTGRFQVTHVVTAGSPIGLTSRTVPPGVRVLALENAGDIVPHTEGAPNPDRRNVTTVASDHDHGDVLDNHSIEKSYVPVAGDADHSDDASVRDFVDSAHDFLSAERSTTHAYDIVRR